MQSTGKSPDGAKGVAVAVKEFVELAGRCCSHFSSEYIKKLERRCFNILISKRMKYLLNLILQV